MVGYFLKGYVKLKFIFLYKRSFIALLQLQEISCTKGFSKIKVKAFNENFITEHQCFKWK
ncbi:hypothetical protein ATB99_14375 [Elizabethkingia meningoseptica]|nr:hypothetical protein BBD33_15770 [Elizabethkingia meningoseptica]AQX48666.1 hypothetical protein B5G46_15765 [Elizabethkingia meningoseptica]KUY13720.1 hypothetical protein ATB99_14375 [Elizabethkingia meningoseptica]OPB75615.1 hypothetical protein BAY30_00725 [Elizabethkingia meningoseptica]